MAGKLAGCGKGFEGFMQPFFNPHRLLLHFLMCWNVWVCQFEASHEPNRRICAPFWKSYPPGGGGRDCNLRLLMGRDGTDGTAVPCYLGGPSTSASLPYKTSGKEKAYLASVYLPGTGSSICTSGLLTLDKLI